MNIRELQSFITLSELGSIARTAEELYVSSPAIHRRIKSLEEKLDVQLYEKVGHKIRLTEVAEGLIPHAKNLLSQRDAIQAYVKEFKGAERNILRIGAGSTFSSYLLPSLIEAFRDQIPEAEVFVDTGETPVMLNDVSDGKLDLVFAVSSDHLKESNYVVQASWSFDILMVGNPNRLAAASPEMDLKKSPFILFRKEEGVFSKIVDRYFAQADFEPHIAMVFDNLETTKAMTNSGLGLSMLPEWTVRAELEGGVLTSIPGADLPLPLSISLVTRKTSHFPEPVSTFLDLARRWTWEAR